MFNQHFGLESATISGCKQLTHRRLRCDVKPLLVNGQMTPNVENYLIQKYSRYKVGSRVAVRQSYETIYNWMRRHGANEPQLIDYHLLHRDLQGWGNKMFVSNIEMPFQIEITNIRIERLQDISDADCIREGIHAVEIDVSGIPNERFYYVPGIRPKGKRQPTWELTNGEKVIKFRSPRDAFHALITRCISPYAWIHNDWQLVYTYRCLPADNPYFRDYHEYTIDSPACTIR